MANFSNLALTVNGIKALLRAQIGEKLTLSKIGLGSGSTTNGTNLTSLVTPKLIMPISEKEINEDSGYMTISAIMTNENITEGFYWRETGLFFEDSNGNDVLFAYTCVTNNEYDYIPAYSDQRYLKYVRIADIVTGSADITIKETQGLLYVDTLTFESFKKEIKEAMENIESNSLTNKDEDGNQRQLVVNGTENNGKDAIYIVDTVNGEEVIFSIFGDHNLPPVVDNLESESSELGLSAKQGKIIKQYITAENGTVFQFAYDESSGEYGYIVTDSEGADTFYPFKDLVRDTPATATAAMITEGFTAWVNGQLITGTRPAPSTMQSGSFSVASASYETVTQTVYFSPEFDTKPEVTYTVNAYAFSMQSVEVYTTHVIFKLLHSHGNDHHSGTVTWTATV